MNKHILPIALISLVLLNLGCKKSPTEIDKPPLLPTLELSLDDVTCTEAWIKVKKQNDTSFLPISLTLNDKEFYGGGLKGEDTIFFVENLKASTSYSVKGTIQTGQQETKEIKVTTLPTTSHNFTWQTFTFGGDAGSSALVDVAIIDENNIWAVGAIYMNDSLGNPDPHAYNAVHWDGNEWAFHRIMFYTICGQTSLSSYPAKAIYAFNGNDIWFAVDGDQIARFENGVQTQIMCLPSSVSMSINKMWGTSSSDLYAVGNNGNIAHYDGKNWQKIESGTTTDLLDIWGTTDGKTIWVCGISTDNYHSVLLKYENGQSTTIWQRDGLVSVPPYGWGVGSVWMNDQTLYLTSGSGIYLLKGETTVRMPKNIYSYSEGLRGNGGNDLMTIAPEGRVWHFNGGTWETLVNGGLNHFLIGCNVKGNTAIVVGTDFSVGLGSAMIQIGRR